MVKKDFQQRYIGNFLGVLWAFIQPSITIFIFWFVFQVGFKSKPVGNFPFVLWLCCGMFPWFFFSDAINSATGSIVSNAYLVKNKDGTYQFYYSDYPPVPVSKEEMEEGIYEGYPIYEK